MLKNSESQASTINRHNNGSNVSHDSNRVKTDAVASDTGTNAVIDYHITKNVEACNKRSFFTKENADAFKRLLATPESYAYHLKALWMLRRLLVNKVESECNGRVVRTNPVFPFLETINEIIECLLVDGIHFGFNGIAHEVINGQIEYLPCKESY